MRSSETRTCGTCRCVTALFAAILLAWGVVGCTTVKNAARSVGDASRKAVSAVTPGGSSRVRHTVALIGTESQFGPGRIGFDAHFTRVLSDALRTDCHDLLVDEGVSALVTSPPLLPSGRVDSFGLGAMGRPRGLEYFVIGTLNGLTFKDEKTGFWWWKGTRYKLRVAVRLEIVDSASGTKLLDDPFAEEIELDENRYELLKEAPVPPLSEIAPALERILREAAERTCEVLKNQPWQGFITAAENGRITISSGSSAGLVAGMRLEVFGPGRLMQSKDGQRFFKPGDKVGEAELSSVAADRAEARLAVPQPNLTGGVVRLR
jgi:hypothetical protein